MRKGNRIFALLLAAAFGLGSMPAMGENVTEETEELSSEEEVKDVAAVIAGHELTQAEDDFYLALAEACLADETGASEEEESESAEEETSESAEDNSTEVLLLKEQIEQMVFTLLAVSEKDEGFATEADLFVHSFMDSGAEEIEELFGADPDLEEVHSILENFYTAFLYGAYYADGLAFTDEEYEAAYADVADMRDLYSYRYVSYDYSENADQREENVNRLLALESLEGYEGEDLTTVEDAEFGDLVPFLAGWLADPARITGERTVVEDFEEAIVYDAFFDGRKKDDTATIDLLSTVIPASNWIYIPDVDAMDEAEKAAEDFLSDPDEEEITSWQLFAGLDKNSLPEDLQEWLDEEDRAEGDVTALPVDGGYRLFAYAGENEMPVWKARLIPEMRMAAMDSVTEDTEPVAPHGFCAAGLSEEDYPVAGIVYGEDLLGLNPASLVDMLGEPVDAIVTYNERAQKVFSDHFLGGMVIRIEEPEEETTEEETTSAAMVVTTSGKDEESVSESKSEGSKASDKETDPAEEKSGEGKVEKTTEAEEKESETRQRETTSARETTARQTTKAAEDRTSQRTTEHQTERHTQAPTTASRTQAPTTEAPTTARPTERPTERPTQAPTTEAPTTARPTERPTERPTQAPTTEAPTTAHQHSWQETGRTNATCTAAGTIRYQCRTCGQTKSENIPATGSHNFVQTSRTEPTCSARGVVTYTCSKCGEKKTESIAATGKHEWTTQTKAATCDKAGKKVTICSVCGTLQSEESIPATGHKWVESGRSAATCSKAGSVSYKCSVCGQTKSESLAATGQHNWVTSEVPATCATAGSSTVKCSVCGVVQSDTPIPATGHKWVESGRTAATCGAAGSVSYRCSACGQTKSESLAATGQHTWVTSEVPATCATAGSRTVKCSVCGVVQSDTPIAATGAHNWVETGRTNATCGAAGAVSYQCSVCGQTRSEAIAATGQHTWVDVTTVVHHDEVGHYDTVTVVDQPAWDETVTTTEWRVEEWYGTHYDGFESRNVNEVIAHVDAIRASLDWKSMSDEEFDRVDSSLSWYSSPRDIPYEVQSIVHHDAVTHTEQRYVVDQAAWDETVVTGHKCSVCGAVQ